MRPEDTAAALDRDEFDGDETDLFGIEPSGADSMDRVEGIEAEADPVTEVEVEPDEDLLEAELGECDALIADDPELDELDDNFDPAIDEVDDEYEMALIQDLGIDLDAPDDLELGVALGAVIDDDSGEDEVAA